MIFLLFCLSASCTQFIFFSVNLSEDITWDLPMILTAGYLSITERKASILTWVYHGKWFIQRSILQSWRQWKENPLSNLRSQENILNNSLKAGRAFRYAEWSWERALSRVSGLSWITNSSPGRLPCPPHSPLPAVEPPGHAEDPVLKLHRDYLSGKHNVHGSLVSANPEVHVQTGRCSLYRNCCL